MKRKNNNLILIGAAIVLYFFFKKKIQPSAKQPNAGGGGGGLFSSVTPMQKAKIRAQVKDAVSKINIEPQPDEMDSYEKQYQQDIKACKI